MPRVYEKKKFNMGRDYHCGRCGRKIEPGEQYFSWSFRYGGTRTNCADHRPRPSELTQSKMAEVYAAIEGAEDTLESAETVAEMREAIESVAEQVQQTAEEYREADEAFGGMGATESAERADELESWASDLEYYDPDEPDEPDEDDDEEEEDDGSDALEDARNEAQDLLNNCPL